MAETMKWERGSLLLLDQTQLPSSVEWIRCTEYRRVIAAIRRLEVRGAPAIGAAAAFAMVLAWRQSAAMLPEDKRDSETPVTYTRQNPGAASASALPTSEDQEVWDAFIRARQELDAARPTAVNLSWATRLMYTAACEMQKEGLSAGQIDSRLEQLALRVYEQDISRNRKIGEQGATLLPENAVILTHCNAGALATCGWGTALGVIRSAHAQGRVKMVYADETRPLLQGSRLTAWELRQDHIPVTTITDNMAAWVMKTKGVNCVITGADRIAANGDTANKIGTYGIALLARAHGIPFYVAAPASTFDFTLPDGDGIPIEERSPEEVRSFRGAVSAPSDVPVFNPAFDVTPAGLITGIITEYGVLKPPLENAISALQANLLKEDFFAWKA